MNNIVKQVDQIVDDSLAPAAKALAPLLRDVREIIESSDGYDAADAKLRRLEGKARADGLEGVLVRAMMNGTSVGGV
jgi:phage gp29-like protein